jgi:GDSL-like Lipase/Acylhydrolase family
VSVLALGDSITRKGPWGALGLPDRSWAWFLAQTLGEPLTNLAADGARAGDVRREQLPRAGGGHSLALVYVGVNDTRALDWDPDRFAEDFDAILAGANERAARVLTLTIPLDLGRPRAGAKVPAANALIEAAAARHGANCADLAPLTGRLFVLPDAVHLTPRGQLEVADVAARALGTPLPSTRFPRKQSVPARAHFAYKYARDMLRRG